MVTQDWNKWGAIVDSISCSATYAGRMKITSNKLLNLTAYSQLFLSCFAFSLRKTSLQSAG
jgi:hypothetical protein